MQHNEEWMENGCRGLHTKEKAAAEQGSETNTTKLKIVLNLASCRTVRRRNFYLNCHIQHCSTMQPTNPLQVVGELVVSQAVSRREEQLHVRGLSTHSS
jgi:hypothetical protein